MICDDCYWHVAGSCNIGGIRKISDTMCNFHETEDEVSDFVKRVMNGDYIIKDF